MEVDVREIPLAEVDADLLAVGVLEGAELPEPLRGAPGASDVRDGFRKTAMLYPGKPGRALAVGLGKGDDFEPERARVAAALAAKRAASLKAGSLAWALPESEDPEATAVALVDGVILASFRFDRFRKPDEDDPTPRIERLTLVGPESLASVADVASIVAEAQNRARDLQELPSNVATPSYHADRAAEIVATHDKLSFEVFGREEISDKKMGGLEAVSRGSAEEPKLVVLRYQGGGSAAPVGLVGKAVTFDSGGISIKPAQAMHEMKMDMSGGAAVIEAMAAVAELDLGLNLIAVVPATENMPSGTATKPGDVITQYNGKTVEINNTDAEGRVILGDALAYCVELGADRVVDLATLTGAVLIALGSTYAALISNDDGWAAEVAEAADRSGEIAWRLPLHEEYKELTKGTIADLTNASAKRKAGTIYAASFLEEFVDGKPWVHLDIAGTAWDTGREYVGKGPTGYGVRLLVSLARDLSKT
ncbi:MAG: leucyl aminopeptidase [Solirubrobacterales bacterium]